MPEHASRRLDWPDCRNARDLGGLPRLGGHTRRGVFVRSDTSANLTQEGSAAMLAYGITTIVDLRRPSEVVRSPYRGDQMGPVYRHLPLIDDDMTARLDEAPSMLDRYLMMVDECGASIRAIIEALADADGGLVFHCFAGKDRTGIVAALVLALAGVPDDAIAQDFAETDVQLASRYEEWLAAAPPDRLDEMKEDLRCPPERMLEVLHHLRVRWGGVEDYLEAAGMKPAAFDRLIKLLV